MVLLRVIDSKINLVEHPEVVAHRIEAAVAAVGDREHVTGSETFWTRHTVFWRGNWRCLTETGSELTVLTAENWRTRRRSADLSKPLIYFFSAI
jgi:hypothetical protein